MTIFRIRLFESEAFENGRLMIEYSIWIIRSVCYAQFVQETLLILKENSNRYLKEADYTEWVFKLNYCSFFFLVFSFRLNREGVIINKEKVSKDHRSTDEWNTRLKSSLSSLMLTNMAFWNHLRWTTCPQLNIIGLNRRPKCSTRYLKIKGTLASHIHRCKRFYRIHFLRKHKFPNQKQRENIILRSSSHHKTFQRRRIKEISLNTH